ncbi:gamma-glutamylaminecyclotransferase B-like [Aplochiton taeniatus]
MRGISGATLYATLLICLPSIQMTRIFVYGTLKTGQPNYFRMVDKSNGAAKFLGTARTVKKYPLVIAGEYNIPFLLNIPGDGQRIRGELYEVDDKMLAFLDDFESCPTMYQRTPVKLELDADTEESLSSEESTTEAFVYSTTAYKPEWPKRTTYENYDAYGDHGLVYVNREGRH